MSASRRREGRETREDGRAAGARLSRPGRKVQRGALGPVLAVHVVARGDPLAERVHVARASGGEDVQSGGGLVPHRRRRRRRRRRHAEVTASECARRAPPLAIFISCTPAEHRELRIGYEVRHARHRSVARHSRVPHPPSPVASHRSCTSRRDVSRLQSQQPRALFALHPLPPRVASHPKDEMRYFLYVAMNCATKPSRWMMGFCPSCSLCS